MPRAATASIRSRRGRSPTTPGYGFQRSTRLLAARRPGAARPDRGRPVAGARPVSYSATIIRLSRSPRNRRASIDFKTDRPLTLPVGRRAPSVSPPATIPAAAQRSVSCSRRSVEDGEAGPRAPGALLPGAARCPGAQDRGRAPGTGASSWPQRLETDMDEARLRRPFLRGDRPGAAFRRLAAAGEAGRQRRRLVSGTAYRPSWRC